MIIFDYCFSKYLDVIDAISDSTVIIKIGCGTVVTIIGERIVKILARTLQNANDLELRFVLKNSDCDMYHISKHKTIPRRIISTHVYVISGILLNISNPTEVTKTNANVRENPLLNPKYPANVLAK